MGDPSRFLGSLRREFRHGVLPLWILEALEAGPTYGYALLAELSRRHGPDLAVTPSTLYPALARLRAHRLVRSFHGTTSHGPLRKYYELTPAGRTTLPLLRDLAERLRPFGSLPRATAVAPHRSVRSPAAR